MLKRNAVRGEEDGDVSSSSSLPLLSILKQSKEEGDKLVLISEITYSHSDFWIFANLKHLALQFWANLATQSMSFQFLEIDDELDVDAGNEATLSGTATGE